jgi:hypothetical protein
LTILTFLSWVAFEVRDRGLNPTCDPHPVPQEAYEENMEQKRTSRKDTLQEMLLVLLWIISALLFLYAAAQLWVVNVTVEPELTRQITFLCLALFVLLIINVNYPPITKWAGILMMGVPPVLAFIKMPFDTSALLNPGMVLGVVLFKMALLQIERKKAK